VKAIFVELPAFALYDKDEMEALQRKALKEMLKAELEARRAT